MPSLEPLDPRRWKLLVLDQDGKVVRTRELAIPVALAIGEYERLSTEELKDHATDIRAELARR